ncbi:MAG: T9SS type A sorting domain-containing protein [Saprospiraceae bacterium]|nr:T9SS type A sorting domain-containing protein [Saprospiraceae bacterium]
MLNKYFLFLIVVLQISSLQASSFFVSTSATSMGDGSFDKPWLLQTAFNHPLALKPGDTVWIRGGRYTNTYDVQTSFSCKTNGTENAAIIFRNYNDERVLIDGQYTYTIYLSLGSCSYTWLWGLEILNSSTLNRNTTRAGGITCTAENMKFINLVIHDTGSGLDCWKTAKNSEAYGCLIYNIGNNENNNGNLEGHGHGMYLQNDTFGTKRIQNNIICNTYGNGIKIWQTTTTAALGNFDVQRNIIFNGGAASENLGGVGNNSRTHNFFVVANGVNNPIRNTVIKHNYTFAGTNTPRPPVNAFGLNYGVQNMILDSNYLTCQTRLGFNNTPIFDASVKGNKIIGGIPAVYGVYLWGFLESDFSQNTFIPDLPTTGLEYFVLPNKYEPNRANIVVYNWSNEPTIKIDISKLGLIPGDPYELINALDFDNDILTGVYPADGVITIPMIGHTAAQAFGSTQSPVSQFPTFGAFIVRQKAVRTTNVAEKYKSFNVSIIPNPFSEKCIFTLEQGMTVQYKVSIYNLFGTFLQEHKFEQEKATINKENLPAGIYIYQISEFNGIPISKGKIAIE